MNPGGLIPGTMPVRIPADECVLRLHKGRVRRWRCARRDRAHRIAMALSGREHVYYEEAPHTHPQ